MSRHDAVLARADSFPAILVDAGAVNVVKALAYALREEIKAHDKTRIERNTGSQRVATLLGNVRGLETKVSALQAELDSIKGSFAHGAAAYHEGYLAGLVAAQAAIKALEGA